MVSSGAVLSLFAQLNLIPMPRDMKVSEGECRTSVAPKAEIVATIPPEGYELSITPDGVTIRHSDDAGLFYAQMTLRELRSPGTATLTELEWKMWPRGLALAEILWMNLDPSKRDLAEFSARAAEHRRRLIRKHVNCAPLK